MRSFPARYIDRARSRDLILHPGSPEFAVAHLLHSGPSSTGTVGWPSVNDPVAIPFCVSKGIVVRQLGIRNGTTPGNNFDLGIYDPSFNRLVSTGSTLGSGASVWQWVDIADYELPSGRYYFATSRDSQTSQRTLFYAAFGTALHALFGVMDSTTDSFPLADPLAAMVACATFTRLPNIAIAARVPW